MHGFAAFAIAFSILFHVWHSQNSFFRRFGLQDTWTIVLNGTLLFLVPFYVYPLKFLFTLLVNEFLGGQGLVRLKDGQLVPMLENAHQANMMMLIYGSGFVAVFVIFVLLYLHALRLKDQLHLSEIEQYDARESIEQNIINGLGGTCVHSQCLLLGNTRLAGLSYLLIAPCVTLQRTIRGRQRRRRFGMTANICGPPKRI